MNKKIIKYLADPLKSRLIIDIQTMGQATTKTLLEKNPQIPQATLYRYLKSMLKDDIIQIVAERKIRNVTEKVYEVAFDMTTLKQEMIEKNDAGIYFLLFQQFMNGLLKEFRDYSMQEEIDIVSDGSGFKTMPFYATTEELIEMSQKVDAVMRPYYENEATPDRKLRTFARIITPSNQEKDREKEQKL